MLQVSDWVLIGTTIFLGIIAIIAPYVSDRIKTYLLRPDLELTYKHTQPWTHKTYWRPKGVKVDQFSEPVYFFRLEIKNTGKSQAREIEVIIEDLWFYDVANRSHQVEDFTPLNLRYDERGTVYINLNPERRVFWAIGHISSEKYQSEIESDRFIDLPGREDDELRLMLEYLVYPHSQTNALLPGRYIIKVSVYSENVDAKTAYFEITWSGNWRDDENQMNNEIVITKLDSFPND